MSAALLENFDLLAASVGGVARLRELILSLAVRGRLVPQDPSDEPASELLKRIRAEKDRLIKKGRIKRDKPVPRISEEEKPYDLPEGWEWARLPSICHDWGQKVPNGSFTYIDVGAIDNRTGKVTGSLQLLDAENAPSRARKIVKKGTVIYSTVRPYLLNVAVVETEHSPEPIASTAFAILHPHSGMLSDYIFLYLRSSTFTAYVESKMIGVAYPAINDANFFSGLIPVPPSFEQSRIVAKVEELMALCDRLEAEQDHAARVQGHWVDAALDQFAESADADEFRRHWQHLAAHFDALFTTPESIDRLDATLLQLAVRGKLVPQDPNQEPASELLKQIRAEKDRLIKEGKIKRDKPLPPIAEDEKRYELPEGWEWARLNDIYDVRDGTHDSPKFHDKGVPLVTSKNIYSGVLDLTNVKFISQEDHQQISIRSKVERGDILFAMIGSIGNPVIVDVDADFSIKNMALFKRYKSEFSNMNFLLLCLKVAAVNMKREAAGGVQSFISLGGLRKHSVPLPPLAEQSRIVAQVDKLQALTASLKARITAARTKQAHLAEALIAEVV